MAMSRSALSAAAMPSPVTPIDAASHLLLRPGIIPTTCVAGVNQPSAVSARTQLTVDTAIPTSILPLGVVVTSDSATLGKVPHISQEMAKNLLQQSGQ